MAVNNITTHLHLNLAQKCMLPNRQQLLWKIYNVLHWSFACIPRFFHNLKMLRSISSQATCFCTEAPFLYIAGAYGYIQCAWNLRSYSSTHRCCNAAFLSSVGIFFSTNKIARASNASWLARLSLVYKNMAVQGYKPPGLWLRQWRTFNNCRACKAPCLFSVWYTII